jgi:hypothetical protein
MYNLQLKAVIMSRIRPSDIDASQPFFGGTFGTGEAEIAAQYIVRFCQRNGNSWRPFTKEQIQAFYEALVGPKEFRFCCLIQHCDTDVYHIISEPNNKEPWIEQEPDGAYRVTRDFIHRCHERFPAKVAK